MRKFIFWSYLLLLLIIILQFNFLAKTAIELHRLKKNLAVFIDTIYKINAEIPAVNQTIKTNTLLLQDYLNFEKTITEGRSIMDKYDFIKTHKEYK